MAVKKKGNISSNVINRLPAYLRQLDKLTEAGETRISSRELGEIMDLTPSQIRQDLSCFGEFGQQGYGYHVQTLRNEIAKILGMDRSYKAIILGTGKIGRAMLEHFDFSANGVTLEAAFDVRPEVVGKTFAGIPVIDAHEMQSYCEKNPIDIAVVCVSAEGAQRAATHACEAGVRAIWNFTNTMLDLPKEIVQENIFFSDSLQRLEYYLSDMLDEEAKKREHL